MPNLVDDLKLLQDDVSLYSKEKSAFLRKRSRMTKHVVDKIKVPLVQMTLGDRDACKEENRIRGQ